jgi:hypothetical protein
MSKKKKKRDWIAILQEIDQLQTWKETVSDDLLEEWKESLQPLIECIDQKTLTMTRLCLDTQEWLDELGKPMLFMVSRGTKSLKNVDALDYSALLSCIDIGLMGIKVISGKLKPLDYEKMLANYVTRLSELKDVGRTEWHCCYMRTLLI